MNAAYNGILLTFTTRAGKTDIFSLITLVSISLGPAGVSAGFVIIFFNWESDGTFFVVTLRGRIL